MPLPECLLDIGLIEHPRAMDPPCLVVARVGRGLGNRESGIEFPIDSPSSTRRAAISSKRDSCKQGSSWCPRNRDVTFASNPAICLTIIEENFYLRAYHTALGKPTFILTESTTWSSVHWIKYCQASRASSKSRGILA